MASAVFPEKRTRSQLTISDDLLSQLSQGSPLKDARTALRHNNSRVEDTTNSGEEIVDETDDELLLSPGKPIRAQTMRTTKRSVSPPPGDEYAFRPKSPSEGRELKRTRFDSGFVPTLNGHSAPPRFAHTRSLSQPESGRSTTRICSGTTIGDSTQDPLNSISHEPAVTGKGRAQSVPLFASPVPSGIVHIDLRNPPTSPRRPRSCSPSKECELRIVTGPTVNTKLDTIPDETGLAMNVDNEPGRTSEATALETDGPAASAISNQVIDLGTASKELMPPPLPHKKLAPLVVPVAMEPPATPARSPSPLSPLTPIPETPPLSKGGREENIYNGPRLGVIPDEENQSSNMQPLPAKPLPALATTRKSRLPRPSSSTNLANLATDPAPPTKKSFASTSTSSQPATTASKPNNAFAILMANARENKEQAKGKGKGKEKVVPAKVGTSFGAGLRTTSGSSKSVQKDKIIDKGKGKELALPKASLKSKMKPKTAQKPKAKPVPAVIPSPPPEVNREPTPPPSSSYPQSPIPVRSSPITRPTTLLIMDVSMENIGPAVGADVLMEIASEIPEPPEASGPIQATEPPAFVERPTAELTGPVPLLSFPTNDVVEVPPMATSNDMAAAPPTVNETVADALVEDVAAVAESSTIGISSMEPVLVELPVTKVATTKVHISKRVPSSIPAPSRVTRSASSKRNQKASEVSKALPVKQTGEQAVTEKKSLPDLKIEVVASPSKLADETVLDTTAPVASLPTEPAVAPGSPMKLSSPAKRTIKTPRSSFAQPTKSAAAKQISSTKLSLSKSRSSSPNKLGRSASMISRSRGSLSRSFASYSNLEGSSLSTLSNALEKLQQRPPERPSTSMGFNRDDPDSSIELEAVSKDDSSIRSSVSNTAKPTSSSQAVAGTSRLVQRTLNGGPRSSLTGKPSLALGSGTLMRGTSGFKVSGTSSKMGSRIFGVGGGVFAGAARARTVQKASRKTTLPSVMASPVKGANIGDAMDVTDDNAQPDGQDMMTTPTETPVDQQAPLNDKGKGKERATEPWNSDASRRASLASQALSQSLASSAKASTGLGSMGPPATPKGRKMARSASSTYPSTLFAAEPESPTRTSLRLAQSNGSLGSKIASIVSAAGQPEASKILKDCVIFVDVRNDDRDEVGSLFVEMLEGVGAKILTRVGQTCTHIVFKNGLMSTINRYRLLRDPKPLVVGIAWVVECVEQRTQVDETKFIVDLDGINVSGTNKRRRSMLPKMISHNLEERNSSDVEGDVSMDGSTSSLILDDDLTPLEKARRRKAAAR
ncbi:hypothetical protein DXG01_004930 [Tephrocybe rancida]|nr:hypothetical protein DXG01_004930 [Tephrocybe rancida]